jgi:hypothetical protein
VAFALAVAWVAADTCSVQSIFVAPGTERTAEQDSTLALDSLPSPVAHLA